MTAEVIANGQGLKINIGGDSLVAQYTGVAEGCTGTAEGQPATKTQAVATPGGGGEAAKAGPKKMNKPAKMKKAPRRASVAVMQGQATGLSIDVDALESGAATASDASSPCSPSPRSMPKPMKKSS